MLRKILIPVIAMSFLVGLLACQSEKFGPASVELKEGDPDGYYVEGYVFNGWPPPPPLPVPGVTCLVYCYNCEEFIFGAGFSNKYGKYCCVADDPWAHNLHLIQVFGYQSGQYTHCSSVYTYWVPFWEIVNLYPAH